MRRGTRTVRVDRGHSALANPYNPRYEAQRDAAARAFGELLTGPPTFGESRVMELGREAGYWGRVEGGWNAMAARNEMGGLKNALRKRPLRVDESPGGGNAEAIVKILNGEWVMEGW